MPRFVSKDGTHTVETSSPADRVELLAQGYRQQKARTAAVKAADKTTEKPEPVDSK